MDGKAIGEIAATISKMAETISELATKSVQFKETGNDKISDLYKDVLLSELENVQLLVLDLTALVTEEPINLKGNGEREENKPTIKNDVMRNPQRGGDA